MGLLDLKCVGGCACRPVKSKFLQRQLPFPRLNADAHRIAEFGLASNETVTMTAHTIFIASRKNNASSSAPPTASVADDECRLTITHHRQRAEKSRVRVDSLALLRHGGSPAVPCAALP